MNEFILYAIAVLALPVSALVVTFVASRGTDRMIAEGRRQRAASAHRRNAG